MPWRVWTIHSGHRRAPIRHRGPGCGRGCAGRSSRGRRGRSRGPARPPSRRRGTRACASGGRDRPGCRRPAAPAAFPQASGRRDPWPDRRTRCSAPRLTRRGLAGPGTRARRAASRTARASSTRANGAPPPARAGGSSCRTPRPRPRRLRPPGMGRAPRRPGRRCRPTGRCTRRAAGRPSPGRSSCRGSRPWHRRGARRPRSAGPAACGHPTGRGRRGRAGTGRRCA